jgi:hypothetical protein
MFEATASGPKPWLQVSAPFKIVKLTWLTKGFLSGVALSPSPMPVANSNSKADFPSGLTIRSCRPEQSVKSTVRFR